MHSVGTKTENVAILLCTFHGEVFLNEQLNSYTQQKYRHWKLYASDDSSNRLTHTILRQFQSRHERGKIHIRKGPRQGFAINFLSLACDETIKADYYAFSDQDDIWEPNKLSNAISWLRTIPSHIPAIYCSRTQLINIKGKKIKLSTYFKKKPSFENALVQNIAGGNTMVFNHAAKKILLLAGIVDVPAHDWWLYLVVTACGGKINYHSQPSVCYRQHANNLIGLETGFFYRIKSIRRLISGQFKLNNEKHLQSLSKLTSYMTHSAQLTLNKFSALHNSNFLKRLKSLFHSNIYRQTFIGNLALIIAILINRV